MINFIHIILENDSSHLIYIYIYTVPISNVYLGKDNHLSDIETIFFFVLFSSLGSSPWDFSISIYTL